MRGTPARVLCAIAVGSMVAATAACGMSEETRAACDAMKKQLESVAAQAQQQVTEPALAAKIYEDAVPKFRSEAEKADGDVAEAADKVVKDMESLVNALQQAAKGNTVQSDMNALVRDGAELEEACKG